MENHKGVVKHVKDQEAIVIRNNFPDAHLANKDDYISKTTYQPTDDSKLIGSGGDFIFGSDDEKEKK
jgi:hypothetical protein